MVVRGERFVALETVAECYRVDVRWVREVYREGLLGAGEQVGGRTVVPAEAIDRAAEVKRLLVHLEVDLETVVLLLRST